MPIIENSMKKILEAGGLAASLNILHWRAVNAASIARECGFQWLFIDMEHSTLDLDTAAQICVAALPTGITPIVRVPSHDHHHATRILNGGAMGIVVPHVNSAEAARKIVQNCKFPPFGHRSLTAPLPQLGYGALPVTEAIEVLNRNTLIIVMLETPHAIEQADAIASVDGIDGIMIGSNDLAAEMGIHGQFGHPLIEQAYATMIGACRRHNRFAGMGGIYEHALMEKFIRMGIRFMLGGGDISFLISAGRARATFLHNLQR